MIKKSCPYLNDILRYMHHLDNRKKKLRVDMALQFTYLFETDPDFLTRCWWSDESNVEIGGCALGNTGKPLPPCSCPPFEESGKAVCECLNSLRPTMNKKAYPKKV